jgi:hypothetical protein
LSEPSGIRLRDVVVVRGEDDHARELAAVRAAEILRASLELRDPAASPAAPSPPPWRAADPDAKTADTDTDPNAREAPPHAPEKPSPRTTSRVVFGAGLSSLMSTDATVQTLSGDIELGVSRSVSLALRAEIPVNHDSIASGVAGATVTPGLVGLGVVVPLTAPSSLVIPRLGGGFGVAWVEATGTTGPGAETPVAPGQAPMVSSSGQKTDNAASAIAYADAAVSLRIVGPLRIAADGIFGASASRIVVRGGGEQLAYWGRPFGALGVRAEIQLP